MQLPSAVKNVITQFATKFPIPKNDEVASQDWTHKLCQQLKFTFPITGWGHKLAGIGRPHSKDTVAIAIPFVGWDIILAAGTSTPELSLNGDSIDLTGQIFELVVAFDSLGSTPPEPPPVPSDIDKKLDLIIAMMINHHNEEMNAITAPRTVVSGNRMTWDR
jgi:hypothetical protein